MRLLTIHPMLSITLATALALALAPTRAAFAAFGVHDPIHAFILAVAVDADTTGNTANVVGSVESTAVGFVGSIVKVDVVVDEISDLNAKLESDCVQAEDTGCGLDGFEFTIGTNPQIARVGGYDAELLLCANGCPNRQSQTEPVPDADGSFFVFELDTSSAPETGEGVLMRFTIECLAAGVSPIDLGHPNTGIPQILDANLGTYPVSIVADASIVCLPAALVGGGQEATIDLSGDPQDGDDSGVRMLNLTQAPGQLGAVLLAGDPRLPGDTVQPGFELIDGTLVVHSDVAAGELRARYLIEYDARAVRRAGIRADQVRLMRRDSVSGRWGRAVRAIQGRAIRRYLPRMRADFELGHHGYSDTQSYVWAVVDVNSRYAVGGPLATSLPALAPVGLVALGAALLSVTGRELRRRRR